MIDQETEYYLLYEMFDAEEILNMDAETFYALRKLVKYVRKQAAKQTTQKED